MKPPLFDADLQYFASRTNSCVPLLRKTRTLLTGGTGFFGIWLTECFLHLNREAGLEASLVVLSRHPDAFLSRAPHLASDRALLTIPGDIRDFAFPPGHFDYVIHAATESVVPQSLSEPDQLSVMLEGTRRALAFATQAGVGRLLFVSSGAVYGPQPPLRSHVGEEDSWRPGEGVYTRGKRAAEQLCLEQAGIASVLARCFAFLGPHLPLRAHFAAGNFVADALAGADIEIGGDGTPVRSYLYAADLAVWLWTLLLRGRAGHAYNVGSEAAISIHALAARTAAVVNPQCGVQIRGAAPPAGTTPARYVPSTRRAREELGLREGVSLDEAIRRTASWYRAALDQR